MIPPNRGTSAASDFEAGLLATALLQQGGAVLSDLALKGNTTALYDMMYAYRKGLGVEKDLSLSSSLLHRPSFPVGKAPGTELQGMKQHWD